MTLQSPGNRREFLKKSVLGTAGILASEVIPLQASPLSSSTMKVINPKIDNRRAVCCIDPEMVTGNPKQWNTIADQNEFIAVEKVQRNIDLMAMTLAQKESVEEAWATIFQKPEAKEWADVNVAIKVNAKSRSGIPKNNPRLAVIDKICKAVNSVGVPFKNIIIFDGDDEDASPLYKEYIGNGLPAEVIVSKKYDALGGKMDTPVPAPWNKNAPCIRDIVNGTVDILINCTVNKGSHNWTGPATVSMKNHYGTFLVALDSSYHTFDFIVATNKSDAIIGGTPPRQQLCIVDSIYACTTGPTDPPNKAPYALVMGTCSPVVDYLTIKRIREDLMGAKHTESIVNRYLADFGFQADDVTDFVYVNAVPAGPRYLKSAGMKNVELSVVINSRGSRLSPVKFHVSREFGSVSIAVCDLKGKKIRALQFSQVAPEKLASVWDGKDSDNRPVGRGKYIIAVRQNDHIQSGMITLS